MFHTECFQVFSGQYQYVVWCWTYAFSIIQFFQLSTHLKGPISWKNGIFTVGIFIFFIKFYEEWFLRHVIILIGSRVIGKSITDIWHPIFLFLFSFIYANQPLMTSSVELSLGSGVIPRSSLLVEAQSTCMPKIYNQILRIYIMVHGVAYFLCCYGYHFDCDRPHGNGCQGNNKMPLSGILKYQITGKPNIILVIRFVVILHEMHHQLI